jgi:hypothetical protein
VSAGHAENINFTVNVGMALPTDVVVAPLPPEVVEVVPEYRGFDYVVANDEIVFIDPSTRLVVGMIDAAATTGEADTGVAIARAKPCPID